MSQTDSIKKSIEELKESFEEKMAEFQSDLNKAGASNPAASSVASAFTAFKSCILKALDVIQTQVAQLTQQVDTMEMRSRRKMLVLHGVQEVQDENTAATVVQELKTIQSSFSVDHIRRCHRLGRPRSSKPRPILVKFCDSAIRDKLWFGKVALKGSGTTISEFLTKSRQETFLAARERFGIRRCWTWEGVIHVLCAGDVRRRVVSLAELEAIPDAPEPPTTSTPNAAARQDSGASGAGKPSVKQFVRANRGVAKSKV